MSTSTIPTGARASRTVLALLCTAQFMLIVDVVVVNVALPSIRADLRTADSRLQLVAVGYTLTLGSLLIVFGRAGDVFGRRRIFLAGMAVFTVASLTTGLAGSEWQLVASRAAQGVGAAMVSPTALTLLMASFAEGQARNRALGYRGAVGSGGAVAGQLLGGLLTDAFGWRSIFAPHRSNRRQCASTSTAETRPCPHTGARAQGPAPPAVTDSARQRPADQPRPSAPPPPTEPNTTQAIGCGRRLR